MKKTYVRKKKTHRRRGTLVPRLRPGEPYPPGAVVLTAELCHCCGRRGQAFVAPEDLRDEWLPGPPLRDKLGRPRLRLFWVTYQLGRHPSGHHCRRCAEVNSREE